jgi:hypothetical protein
MMGRISFAINYKEVIGNKLMQLENIRSEMICGVEINSPTVINELNTKATSLLNWERFLRTKMIDQKMCVDQNTSKNNEGAKHAC